MTVPGLEKARAWSVCLSQIKLLRQLAGSREEMEVPDPDRLYRRDIDPSSLTTSRQAVLFESVEADSRSPLDPSRVTNAFTVDLEDWYQGIGIPPESWKGYASRLEKTLFRLLRLLDDYQVKATFFVLGYLCEQSPHLVREVHKLGHRIGSHTYDHQFVYKLTREQFRRDLERALKVTEDLIGEKVRSFRAPYFSITRKSLWAFDILGELGIDYDSSIFPVTNYRYGIPGAERFPHRVDTQAGELWEFPLSTAKLGGVNLPVCGGAYFRILPFSVTRWGLSKINREGQPFIFYLHPREIDPECPRVALPFPLKFTFYVNLKKTEERLHRLFSEFQFAPMETVLEDYKRAKGSEVLHRESH